MRIFLVILLMICAPMALFSATLHNGEWFDRFILLCILVKLMIMEEK